MSHISQDRNLSNLNSCVNYSSNFTISDINRSIIRLFGVPSFKEDIQHKLDFIKDCQQGVKTSLTSLYNLVKLYNGTLTFYFDVSKEKSLVVNNVDDFFSIIENYCYHKRVKADERMSDSQYKENMEKEFLNDRGQLEKSFDKLTSFVAYKFPSSNFKVSFGDKGYINWNTNNKTCVAYVENGNVMISYDIKKNICEDRAKEPTLITKIAETNFRESDKKFIKEDHNNFEEKSIKNKDSNHETPYLSDNSYMVRNGATVIGGKDDLKAIDNYSRAIKNLIKNGFIDQNLRLTEETINAIGNNQYKIVRTII